MTAAPADPTSSVRARASSGDWETLSAWTASVPLPASFGGNTLEVEVTATTGKSRLYESLVHRIAPGTIDSSFLPGEIGSQVMGGGLWPLALLADGKMLVAGHFSAYANAARAGIARLNSDGSVDLTFCAPANISAVGRLATQAGGKVLIAGRLSRLNADGTIDASLDPGTSADAEVDAIAIQPSGRVIVGDWFTLFDGTGRSNLARRNPDGSLDPTFDTRDTAGTGVDTEFVQALALQSNGKLLLSGYFWLYGNRPDIVSRV